MNTTPNARTVTADAKAGPPVDLQATQIEGAVAASKAGAGSPAESIQVGGSNHAMLGTNSETANLRNTTVLPDVQGAGEGVKLKPRNEARYEHIKPLGSGAMGEVNLVRDNDIGRTVAVKQLGRQTQNPAGIARFIEEIRTIGQLEHPNIVPIHDVGVDDKGQVFFVMKHIDGETLESIIAKLDSRDPAYMARYTIDYRIEIFLGLLRALQYAHAKGIVHRDIKPANIMIGSYGEVVLMDWGVAKIMPNGPVSAQSQFATQEGTIIGTPAYMSPEQASGNISAIDARSDLYSATVLFHEFLALRHYLLEYETFQQLVIAILSERFPYLRLVFIRNPRHPVPPAELLHFIAKGLAKEPVDRYQSAAEMIEELQRIRDGRCRVSCPATLARRSINVLGSFIARYPKLSPFVFYSTVLFMICYFVITAHMLISRVR